MSAKNKPSSSPKSTVPDRQDERRGVPRYAANPDTVCRVLVVEGEKPQPAELHNVSTHGLQMLVPRTYEVGTPLIVQLTHKEGTLDRRVMVRVVRVHESPKGKFAMGCAFLSPLEGHELLALVM